MKVLENKSVLQKGNDVFSYSLPFKITQTKTHIKCWDVIKYVITFILLVLFARAKALGSFLPLSSAFLFAVLPLSFLSPWLVLIEYFIANLIIHFSNFTFINCLFISIIFIISILINKKFKRINITFYLFLFVLSQAYLINNFAVEKQLLIGIASVVVAGAFFYVVNRSMKAIYSRGLFIRFSFDENICLGLFIMGIFLGFNESIVFGIDVFQIVMVFGILFCAFVLGGNSALFFAAIAGLSMCFYNNSLIMLGIFITFALTSIVTKDLGKWCSAFSILITDIVIGLFLNGYALYNEFNIIATIIGCLLFLVIPKKYIKNISVFLGNYEINYSENYVFDNSKKRLKNKLLKTSEVFDCLGESYKKMISGNLDSEKVKNVLLDDVKQKVCGRCENCNKCFSQDKLDFNSSLFCLIETGLTKKKVNLLDLPNLLSTYCCKVNMLLSEINCKLDELSCFENNLDIENKSRLLTMEQFKETSELLKILSQHLNGGEERNNVFEKKLIDELLLRDILTKEAYVFENKQGIEHIILVVRKNQVNNDVILQAMLYLFKIKFVVTMSDFAYMSGWVILNIEPAPSYDIMLGSGKKSKQVGACGDNYSLVALDNNKYMAIIADGMGQGENASIVSKTALNIIENFYRAGFESEVIVRAVNRFLNYSEKELFSSIDIFVVDTASGRADFIKMGSSVSVIKRKNQSEIIDCSALPVGIVKDVQVKVQKRILFSGDIVVLASDGVVDSFGSFDNFSAFINNNRLINVQLLAEDILEQAFENYKFSNTDDMSVVVIRLITSA